MKSVCTGGLLVTIPDLRRPGSEFFADRARARRHGITSRAEGVTRLLARVPPDATIRTGQFMDGTKKLGDPVRVRGGHAFLISRTLTVGTHSLSAVFTPPTRGPSSRLRHER